MALKIKPKNRYSTGLPDPSILDTGELWVNTADKVIGIKDNQNQVIVLADLTKEAADLAYLSVNGNAASASKLATAQTISIAGDATGSGSFDGSAPVSISVSLANSGATAGTYGQASAATITFGSTFTVPAVTVDAKGRVTGVANTTITVGEAPTDITGNASTATALQNVRYLDGIAFNGSDNVTRYAVCDTVIDAAAKTVTVNNWGLYVGSVVIITLTAGNSATNPTLDVNSSGAKPIINTGVALGNVTAGATIMLVYDGTNYQVVGGVGTGDLSAYYTKAEMDAKFMTIVRPTAQGTMSIYGQDEAEAQPVIQAYNAAVASAAENTGVLNCYTKEEADAIFAKIQNPVIIDTLTIEDGTDSQVLTAKE